ncbi:MAG TPA: FRG domain-containing protein [Steroidobacteraceae bacterium]|nr:FRG domain-containing protein [Steroidobacteraceae bacterium]
MADITIKEIAEIYSIRRGHWDGHFIYRGENSSEYSLRPKFGRKLVEPYKAASGKAFPAPAHEQPMLTEFKRFAAPHLSTRPEDEWDWLAIAQHHGLATRLLDWTSNILVAAYFACVRPRKEDAVIYVLDTEKIQDAPLSESPFSVAQNVVFHPRHSTARIAAQAGVFTSHADPALEFSGDMLQRVILPARILVELSVTLSTFDITKAKLFPGLDSVAERINDRNGCT